jgi:hypothetical protein
VSALTVVGLSRLAPGMANGWARHQLMLRGESVAQPSTLKPVSDCGVRSNSGSTRRSRKALAGDPDETDPGDEGEIACPAQLAERQCQQATAKQHDAGNGDSEKTIGSEFVTHDATLQSSHPLTARSVPPVA